VTSDPGRLRGPKRELWLAWYVTVAFYGMYSVIFFGLSRTQPPGRPHLDPDQTVAWFADRHWGLLIGFGLVFVVGGFSSVALGLITYSIRRMSVSPVFAFSYLILYAIAAIPGFMYICVAMTAGVMRPDRNPVAAQWLYDLGFLSFVGTMGVFLIGSLIWMVAILLDTNGVFPRWFGYLCLVNALTEVVIAPSWIFQRGVLAYNGAIGFWVNVPVFALYTTVFIYLLRDFIQRDDLGSGPLPTPPLDVWRRLQGGREAVPA
jgi:hypothetical protein